eukprot:Tbor_TRINITY_DN2752_c0_g1::TRINITY_DN2752_c0_g1_i1::g.15255::m.15255
MKRSRSEDIEHRCRGDFLIEAIGRKLDQFEGMNNIEIETRLCTLTVKNGRGAPIESRFRPQIESAAIISNPHGVSIGLEKGDFDAIKAYLMAMKNLVHHRSITKTVSLDKRRLTTDAEGKPISFMEKIKLRSVDIAVPFYPYDIRVGVAQETELDLSLVPEGPHDGYTRQKSRDTFTCDELGITYDLTEVNAGERSTYEFEVEKLFDTFKNSNECISDMVYRTKEAMDVVKAARKAKHEMPVLPVAHVTNGASEP